MKVTACFNIAFDVEVPNEIVEKARDAHLIEKTELFEKIRNTPEFKQIFSENVDGEITAIIVLDEKDPWFEDIVWEE